MKHRHYIEPPSVISTTAYVRTPVDCLGQLGVDYRAKYRTRARIGIEQCEIGGAELEQALGVAHLVKVGEEEGQSALLYLPGRDCEQAKLVTVVNRLEEDAAILKVE